MLFILMLMLGVLSACEVEGGIPEPTVAPPLSAATRVPTIAPTSAVVANQLAERRDTWTIGLSELPEYVLPALATDQGTDPVRELLFPAPLVAYGGTYTTTGVLTRVPSFANGDIEARPATVYLDPTGAVTTTVTMIITQVEQLAVTFHWNPELRWADGVPVTADDSLFAYDVARSAADPQTRELLAQIASYERVDDYTTRAVLIPDFTGPTPFLSYWAPLPRHVLRDIPPATIATSSFARAPVGYGVFVFDRRSADEIYVVRNPHAATTPPGPSRLQLRRFDTPERMRANLLNGTLDVALFTRVNTDLIAALDRDAREGVQLFDVPSSLWEHIDFNLDVEALQDIRVRRAIALGTDRSGMARTLFAGRVAVLDSWVLPFQDEIAPADQITRYPYDQAQARQLLDEAEYLLPPDTTVRASTAGVTLTLDLIMPDGSAVRRAIADQFRNDMRAVGIEIIVNELPVDAFFAADGPLYQRQFSLALFGWDAATEPGGLRLWSCAAIPVAENNWRGDNFSGWCFRDADRAIRTAETVRSPEERRAAYALQQQLWTQELPALPLFQRLTIIAAGAEVDGLRPDSLAPLTWNIARWQRIE